MCYSNDNRQQSWRRRMFTCCLHQRELNKVAGEGVRQYWVHSLFLTTKNNIFRLNNHTMGLIVLLLQCYKASLKRTGATSMWLSKTLPTQAKEKRATWMPKIPFYGLVCGVAWLQERRGWEAGCRGRGRRLSRHKTLHPLMAEMSQRGDGNCLDGRKTSQRKGGGQPQECEEWVWHRVTALLKMLVCSTQQLVEWTDVVKIKSCTFQTIDKWMFWRVHDKGFFSQEEIFFYDAQEENRNRRKTCCVNSFVPCASRVFCKSIHPSLGKYFCKAPYFQVILC